MLDVIEAFNAIGLLAVLVLLILRVAAPGTVEWLKHRLAMTQTRHSAVVDLGKDYYSRRLEAYLSLWYSTMRASRAILDAANNRTDADWDPAWDAVRHLKNEFWDNRPLMSDRVFKVVGRTNGILRRFLPQYREASGADTRRLWNNLNMEVKKLQWEFLEAIDLDLRLGGVDAAVFDRDKDRTTSASDEEMVTSVDIEEAAAGEDNAVEQLLAYVRGLQLPFAGKNYVSSHFRVPDGHNAGDLITRCISENLLEEYAATDGEGRKHAAIRVPRSPSDIDEE